MAEISTYVCSNTKCNYTLRLSRGFPVWKSETPKVLRVLAANPESAAHITGYRSESLCYSCNKIVESGASCAQCQSANVRDEQAGQECPRCANGIFSLVQLTVY